MSEGSAKTEREKMLAGELYRAADPELQAAYFRAQRLLARFNATALDDAEGRDALLRELFGAVGENAMVLPRFACDYGTQIRAGRNLFVNHDCVFLDCAAIELG
ncbi:MAG: maltose acetyltransferase domain-containing protein, partial [Gemmatimonadota bacterium]